MPCISFAAFALYIYVDGVFIFADVAVFERASDPINQWSREQKENLVQTLTFVTWMIGHVLLAHSMRVLDRSILFDSLIEWTRRCRHAIRDEPSVAAAEPVELTLTSNPLLLLWTFLSFFMVLVGLGLPPVRQLLELQDPTFTLHWTNSGASMAAILPCIFVPIIAFVLVEFLKFVRSKTQ